MTSPPTDPGPATPDDLDPGDDAVLAVLDGTASADQRRQVARDPVLRDRLAAQQEATAALAAPVAPLPPEAAARLRARALDALGTEEADDGAASATGPAVVPLAPRRSGRRLPPWPAVAAVVILLMGVGLALIVNDRNSSPRFDQVGAELSEADDGNEAAARELGADAGSGRGPIGPESATDGASEAAAANLLRFPDEEALRQALQEVDPTTLAPLGDLEGEQEQSPTADSPTADSPTFCEAGLLAVEPTFSPAQAARLVRVGDREVVVLSNQVEATAEEGASTRLTVLDARSCTPLFAVQR